MIDVTKLKHGAIYKLYDGTLARCNICSEGSEYWFTDVNGKEMRASVRNVRKKVSDFSALFVHHDIK